MARLIGSKKIFDYEIDTEKIIEAKDRTQKIRVRVEKEVGKPFTYTVSQIIKVAGEEKEQVIVLDKKVIDELYMIMRDREGS